MGGGIAVATGIGLALKRAAVPNVVVCFFGDGAANRGVLYECMNMAALWKLPIVFACENNGYAVDTSVARAFADPHIHRRASGFGLPGVLVDGVNVLAVFASTRRAVARARAGAGPTLMEMVVPRWCGHHLADPQWYYRSREEVEAQKQDCPLQRLRCILTERSLLSDERALEVEAEIAGEVEQAVQFAAASRWPNPEDLYFGLYEGSE